MAKSKCAHCPSTDFELKEAQLNTQYKYVFVQCAKCGAVIGALEYLNAANTIMTESRGLSQKLDALTAQIAELAK